MRQVLASQQCAASILTTNCSNVKKVHVPTVYVGSEVCPMWRHVLELRYKVWLRYGRLGTLHSLEFKSYRRRKLTKASWSACRVAAFVPPPLSDSRAPGSPNSRRMLDKKQTHIFTSRVSRCR